MCVYYIPVCICVYSYINNAGAVGADEARGALAQQLVFDLDHVLLGDALCDAHHQGHASVDGLHDGGTREWRGHVDHCGLGPGTLSRLEVWDMVNLGLAIHQCMYLTIS